MRIILRGRLGVVLVPTHCLYCCAPATSYCALGVQQWCAVVRPRTCSSEEEVATVLVLLLLLVILLAVVVLGVARVQHTRAQEKKQQHQNSARATTTHRPLLW